jgi:hypothetical protein
MHPYLAAPDAGRVDACSLRMFWGAQAVEGTAQDLRRGLRLGVLDDAYTDLDADEATGSGCG